MANQTSSRARKRFFVGGLLIVMLAAGYLLTHRLVVYDFVRLHDYSPSSTISALVTDTTMTDYARHVYLVNHPELKSRSTFASDCPTGTEQTVVLGCYKSNQVGIYLLNVDNAELSGIVQVTAAHEMLHAAYDRLSSSERTKVNAMLEDYYKNGLTDQTIKDTIESYKKTEPTELVNEMHSIFGTQIATLPSGLQQYYTKYFANRSVVTGYYAKYEAAFTSRQNQIKQDEAQLADWKPQIATLQASIDAGQASLAKQRDTLDSYRTSNNIQAYNSGVDSYNRAVANYNQQVAELKQLIVSYNALVKHRNSIALEEQELVKSISSSATSL